LKRKGKDVAESNSQERGPRFREKERRKEKKKGFDNILGEKILYLVRRKGKSQGE